MRGLMILFLLFLGVGRSVACMPSLPSEVMIGRYAGETFYKSFQGLSTSGIVMSSYDFPFYEGDHVLSPQQWVMREDQLLPEVGSLILAFATYNNGDYIHDYNVGSYAVVMCIDDVILLGSIQGHYPSRNRKLGTCRDAHPMNILDGFSRGDGNYRLGVLHNKYPTCASLEEYFPSSVGHTEGLMVSESQESGSDQSRWSRIVAAISNWLGFLG